MLKAAQASVLILLLACSARAGYMQTGGSPVPPPSQPVCAVYEPTDAHAAPPAESVGRNDAPGALTQLALEVLAAMPSLF